MIYLTPSSISRVALCPGSLAASKGLRDEQSDAAREGDLLHNACKTGDLSGLTPTQQDDVTRALELRDIVLAEHIASPKRLEWREKHVRTRYEELWELSGKIDHFARAADDAGKPVDDTFVATDYKFGRGEEDDPSEHMQLRSYGVLLHRELGAKRVVVSLIQPRAPYEKRVRTVTYEIEHLERAVAEISAIARYTQSMSVCERCGCAEVLLTQGRAVCSCGNDTYALVEPERVPGPEQCKWCRASGTNRCPESQQALVLLQPQGVIPEGADMAKLLELGAVATRANYQLIDWAKEQLRRDPNCIPGWELKDNAPRREIENIMGAWERLAPTENGDGILTAEEFVRCCSISVGALEELVCRKQGITPQRTWAAHMAELLGSVIGKKEIAPSLKRTKT